MLPSAGMYLSADDARSDFILTVAAVVLGRYALSLIAQIPGYPVPVSWPHLVLSLGWLAMLTGLVPWLLARYRRDVPDAFSIGPRDRGSVAVGLVVAVPLLVGHLLPVVFSGDFGALLLSLVGRFTTDQPVVGEYQFNSLAIYVIVAVAVLAVGSWLFASFVAVRARESFRSPDADLTELVRTFGMGGVAATFVLGLLNAVQRGSVADALLVSVVLLAIVLLTDQYVPARVTTRRAAMVGPMVAVLVMYVLSFGGLFSGNLLTGLYTGAAAAVVMLCAAALAEVRQGFATAILVVAAVVYPVGGLVMQPVPVPLLLP